MSIDEFDVIRTHILESRYLAAKRLLDKLDRTVIPTDIPLDEVHLVQSQMSAIEGFDDLEDRWTHLKHEDGVDTFFCRPSGSDSSILSVKVEATLDVPVMTCMSLIHEVDLFPNWMMKNTNGMVRMVDARLLRKPKVFDLVAYLRTQPPWPLSEREQCNHYRGVDYLDETPKRIGILCHPLPDEAIPDHIPGATRMKIFEPSGIIFEPISAKTTKLRIVYTIDPWMGYIPDWLIGIFLGFIAPRIIAAVQSGSEIVQSEDFQVRIQDIQSPYYSKLKLRLPDFGQYSVFWLNFGNV